MSIERKFAILPLIPSTGASQSLVFRRVLLFKDTYRWSFALYRPCVPFREAETRVAIVACVERT